MAATKMERLKTHKRVQFLDGRADGFADWFVTLRPGWRWSGDPGDTVHCFGVATLAEAMREVRAAVLCDCDQCRRELEG